MMCRIALLVLAAALPAAADGPPSAADVTERGRPLDRILDAVLHPPAPAPGRTLLFLVDPTPSLARARFAARLEEALARNAGRLAGTRIGVRSVSPGGPDLAPTAEAGKVIAAARKIEAAPSTAIQNVYAPLRAAAADLAGREGSREIVLVTLENGDAEDDLEATVKAARDAGVRVSVVAREAFLSDTWWFRRTARIPPGVKMAGSEGAFVEVPFSFLFQWQVANEAVASGFAMFGLTRLAAASGGKVHLYYPASLARTRCGGPHPYLVCPVCSGDHLDCGEVYQAHRLRALAPLAGSRREVGAVLAKDAYFQAVMSAWTRAARKGITRYRPSVRWAGGRVLAGGLSRGHVVLLGDSLAFGAQEARAERLARACGSIADDLRVQIERAAVAGGSARSRATAELTRVLLLLTRFNLLAYAAFCRETGPAWLAADPNAVEPPEIPVLRPDWMYSRISFLSLSLCHGPDPYLEMRMPGGEALDREYASLSATLNRFLERYAHTPYAQALRKQGIAKFTFAGRAKAGVPAPRWIPAAKGKATTSPAPSRPARGGPPTGGGSGTTTPGSGR